MHGHQGWGWGTLLTAWSQAQQVPTSAQSATSARLPLAPTRCRLTCGALVPQEVRTLG